MPQQATCGWDLFKNENGFTEWAVTLTIWIVKALGITSILLSDCSRGRPTRVGKLGDTTEFALGYRHSIG